MRIAWKLALGLLLMWSGHGCVTSTGPLATLPIVSPTASEYNLAGIRDYNDGNWELAIQHFQEALRADAELAEVHFNLALSLHNLGKHELAMHHFQEAGQLAPHNQSIINSSLYRNHLGLSSIFERHMTGGYRYGL